MGYIFLLNLLFLVMASTLNAQGLLSALGGLSEGRTKVIDLTYPLNSKNAFWPGESYNSFKHEVLASLEKDGVYSGRYSTPEHLGTHMDAPAHFEPNQPTVDKVPLEDLVGLAVVIDVSLKAEADSDYRLKVEDVAEWEKKHGAIPPGAIVLLYTGWGRRWEDYDRYKNADKNGALHFPGFSRESALFLSDTRQVKAVGIDTLSVDYGLSGDFPVHHVFNSRGRWLLENLSNLDKLPPTGATLIVAPIKIEGGSGGQARVWALVRE